MRRLLTCVVLVGALALVAGSALGQANSSDTSPHRAPIKLSDAAAAAISAAYPKATVGKVGYSLSGKTPKKLYSVSLTEGDKKLTVNVSDKGIIVSVIAMADDPPAANLPKVIVDAVNAACEGANITSAGRVELRADPDTLAPLDKAKVSYEIRLTTRDGVKGNMAVAEDGTVIRAPRLPKPKMPTEKPAGNS